jgi:hypothetical protein
MIKKYLGMGTGVILITLLAALNGCNGISEQSTLPKHDLKADLEVLAKARIYFGHQSVGRDILEGVASLAQEQGVKLRIVEAPLGLEDSLPGIIHSKVGRNHEPQTKCAAFEKFLSENGNRSWDAVAFKFCYVDLGDEAGKDTDKLLEIYRNAVASVRTANPNVNLIHITIPLKSDPLGRVAQVKRMLGMAKENDSDNLLRNAFNDRLRSEFPKEPFFDLAQIESTRPDGSRSGFSKNGKSIYTLDKQFTYDEGHLSSSGKKWVAAEFVRSFAAAIRSPSAPTP